MKEKEKGELVVNLC